METAAASVRAADAFGSISRELFPDGALNEGAAVRLLGQIAPYGDCLDAAAFELLLRAIESAADAPPLLPAFALKQLRDAIIAGEGPAMGSRGHFSRVIDADDAKVVRRVLLAGGGAAGKPVSRAEAEALFDLHDAAAGAGSNPEFDQIFLRAVTQHLLASSGHAVPARRDALDGAPLPHARLAGEQATWLSRHITRGTRPTTAALKLVTLLGEDAARQRLSQWRFADFAA